MKNCTDTLTNLSLKIVAFALGYGRETMVDTVKLTEANRNTFKLNFWNLEARGYLRQQGNGPGFWYVLG